MSATVEIGLQVAFSEDQVDRWDREWLTYLTSQDVTAHLLKAHQMEIVDGLAGKSREAVFGSRVANLKAGGLVRAPLRVWADSSLIVGRSVLEFGSGTGFLGKALGPHVEHYLGIEMSTLAIAVAATRTHPRAAFAHVNDHAAIAAAAGRYDLWVGREFFIHQNFAMAEQTLRLGLPLLKSGARISADFYEPNRAIPQGVVHPSSHALDETYASCGFFYTDAEIATLADRVGLIVDEQVINAEHQRRFVQFRKP